MNIIEFKGDCKGVRLKNRSENDNHICVEILTEDDENWFVSETSFSSYWIDELIEQLQNAKSFIETQEPDIYKNKQYGFKFK
jgi:hypothetical protein